MNYEPQLISASMGLEEALKEYSNDINIITLKDGTNIKIVQDNQQFKGKGRQESYNGNQETMMILFKKILLKILEI